MMSAPSYAPPPPPGPGVHPPFPAPPVEGRGRRLGMGFLIGGLVGLLVCGGGVAAAIGLSITGAEALNEQARVVVGRYMDALQNERYGAAYDMLCDRAQRQESPDQFRRRVADEPIASYRMGSLDIAYVTMPVDVTYEDGETARLEAQLEQSVEAGGLEVCGLSE